MNIAFNLERESDVESYIYIYISIYIYIYLYLDLYNFLHLTLSLYWLNSMVIDIELSTADSLFTG